MIIIINPNEQKNIPKFLNETIENNQNEKYIMFIFNDLYEHIIDKDLFFNKYYELLKTYDLPYAFYPYYIHFNKALTSFISIANPKMRVEVKEKLSFDVINQTAYGMLIIDTEKLKEINFKFNETYAIAFYIQELIEECYNKNLYISNSWFIDVYKSYEMIDSNMKDGFKINPKDFTEEKAKFFSVYKQNQPEQGNDFIKKFQEHYINSDKTSQINQVNTNLNQNEIPLITVNGTLGEIK